MDSLTHIALGAVIGEAVMGRSIGKKALLIGALAQSLPDIDFINSFFLDPSQNLLAHRGFTHSVLFAGITTLIFSGITFRLFKETKITFLKWVIFLGLEIFLHLLLDACNAYGVGWFEPFSHQRISFNMLFVADPLFSVWAGIALVALLMMQLSHPKRKYWVTGSLILTSVYFLLSVSNKLIINNKVKETLSDRGVEYKRYLATPTPFNNLLWYFVAEADSGYYIGYRSVLDTHSSGITFFPKQKVILDSLRGVAEVKELVTFSQGYYTVDTMDSTVVFNDLRFGQIMGWNDPRAKFMFRYYLQKPEENLLVMQRGRFTGWNRKSIASMLQRIKGI